MKASSFLKLSQVCKLLHFSIMWKNNWLTCLLSILFEWVSAEARQWFVSFVLERWELFDNFHWDLPCAMTALRSNHLNLAVSLDLLLNSSAALSQRRTTNSFLAFIEKYENEYEYAGVQIRTDFSKRSLLIHLSQRQFWKPVLYFVNTTKRCCSAKIMKIVHPKNLFYRNCISKSIIDTYIGSICW